MVSSFERNSGASQAGGAEDDGDGASAGQCRRTTGGNDEFFVGRVVGASDPEAEEVRPLGRIGQSKVAILVAVFVAAGILGLPLILLSPVFSKLEKVVWTVVVLCYTALVFYILWLLVQMIAGMLRTL